LEATMDSGSAEDHKPDVPADLKVVLNSSREFFPSHYRKLYLTTWKKSVAFDCKKLSKDTTVYDILKKALILLEYKNDEPVGVEGEWGFSPEKLASFSRDGTSKNRACCSLPQLGVDAKILDLEAQRPEPGARDSRFGTFL